MRQAGDKIRLLTDIEAYYSDYAGNPRVIVKRGTVGTITAVNVPDVIKRRGRPAGVFTCADFILPGVFNGDSEHNYCTWRVAIGPGQGRKIPRKDLPREDS